MVARLLKPGGVLSLLDDHPASWLFDQDAATIQASSIDYFEYAMTARGWSEQHIGDLGKPQNEHARKHERLWTMSAIFNALVARGLTVVHLGEHPHEYWNAFPKLDRRQKRTLPTTFSMLARKS